MNTFHQDTDKLIINQNMKFFSVSIFTILFLLIIISLTNLIPIMSVFIPPYGINPLFILLLIITIIYFVYGFFAVTYIFDKKANTMTITYNKFYRKQTKKISLETLESVRFFLFNQYFNAIRAIPNVLAGVYLRFESGEYIKIMLDDYLFLNLDSDNNINIRESKQGKRLAEFLDVPFIYGGSTETKN